MIQMRQSSAALTCRTHDILRKIRFFFLEVKYERILSILFDVNIVLFHFVQHKMANFAFVKVKYCLFLSKLLIIFATTNI